MLAGAIAASLPMAIGIALSPLPIAAVVMILVTARAGKNAPAFLLGWLAGIFFIGAIVFVAPGIETRTGEPTTIAGYARVILGIILLVLAAKQWRGRPKPGAKLVPPKFLTGLDRISVARSGVTGFVLSAVNPKNTVLSAAGAATIDATSLDPPSQLIALLAFAAIAGSSVAMPVAGYFLFRKRIELVLLRLKEWLIRNNVTVLTFLLIVFGALLIRGGLAIIDQ